MLQATEHKPGCQAPKAIITWGIPLLLFILGREGIYIALWNISLCAWHTVRLNKWKRQSVWSKERFMQGWARKMGGSHSKDPDFWRGFREELLKADWGEGCKVCGFLQMGWGWGQRAVLRVRDLSLKPPSSTGAGTLVPAEELRDIVRFNYCDFFPCLTAFPLSLHPLTSLISTCLHLLFGTQGRPQRLQSFSTNKKREQRAFCTQEGPMGPAYFQN